MEFIEESKVFKYTFSSFLLFLREEIYTYCLKIIEIVLKNLSDSMLSMDLI